MFDTTSATTLVEMALEARVVEKLRSRKRHRDRREMTTTGALTPRREPVLFDGHRSV